MTRDSKNLKQALVLGTLPDNKIPDGYEVWEVSPRSVLCNTPRSQGLLDVKDSLSLILIDSGTFAPALCEMDAQVTEVSELLHEHFGNILRSQSTESVDALLRSVGGRNKLLEQFRESVGDSDISTRHASDLVDDLTSNAVVRLQHRLADESYRSGVLEVVARESEIHQPGFEWLRDAFCPYGFVGPVDDRHKEWLKYSSSSPEWERTRDPFLTDAQVLSKFEYEADSPGLHSWLRVIFSRFFHPSRSLILCSTDSESDSFLEELSWAIFTSGSQWIDSWDFAEYPTPCDNGPQPVVGFYDFGLYKENVPDDSDELLSSILLNVPADAHIRCWKWPNEWDRDSKRFIDTHSSEDYRRVVLAPPEDLQSLYSDIGVIKSTRQNFKRNRRSTSSEFRTDLLASTENGWPCAFRIYIARGSVLFLPESCPIRDQPMPSSHDAYFTSPAPQSAELRDHRSTPRKVSIADLKIILSASHLQLYDGDSSIGRFPLSGFDVFLDGKQLSLPLYILAYFAGKTKGHCDKLSSIYTGRKVSFSTVSNEMTKFKKRAEEVCNIEFNKRIGIVELKRTEETAKVNCTIIFLESNNSLDYIQAVKDKRNDSFENRMM